MASTAIRKYKLNIEELANGVSRLSEDGLNLFFTSLNNKIIGKKNLTPQEEEILIIKQIKDKIPASVIRHIKRLQTKLNEESISEKEYAELMELINFTESQNVERVKLLIELSKVRQISPTDLAKEINFKGLYA